MQTFHFFVRVELDNYHVVSHWLTSDALKDSSSNQTHLPVGALVKESCFERFSGNSLPVLAVKLLHFRVSLASHLSFGERTLRLSHINSRHLHLLFIQIVFLIAFLYLIFMILTYFCFLIAFLFLIFIILIFYLLCFSLIF